MKVTEKKVQGIRECTFAMRKALREHYDNYNSAVYQMRGCIRDLKQIYDDETIKMAFDAVSREMLESRKPLSRRRVTEMGRLSNAHVAGKDKIETARSRASYLRANTPEMRLSKTTSEIIEVLQQFCKELNEDSCIKLGVFDASETAKENKKMAEMGITNWVGICPLEDPDEQPEYVTDDERSEGAFAFNIYLQPPTKNEEVVGPNSDSEMEKYGPVMRRNMDWYLVINEIKKGTFTADTLWNILEKDPVLVNYLMTGEEDPGYNPETEEYDGDLD